jgi:hypothetical protein
MWIHQQHQQHQQPAVGQNTTGFNPGGSTSSHPGVLVFPGGGSQQQQPQYQQQPQQPQLQPSAFGSPPSLQNANASSSSNPAGASQVQWSFAPPQQQQPQVSFASQQFNAQQQILAALQQQQQAGGYPQQASQLQPQFLFAQPGMQQAAFAQQQQPPQQQQQLQGFPQIFMPSQTQPQQLQHPQQQPGLMPGAQVVLLPNGQYALLQPSTNGQFAQAIPIGVPPFAQPVVSPSRGGFNSSNTASPGHSLTQMPNGQFFGGALATPGASSSRTPQNQALGASTSTSSRPLCDTAVWGYAIVDPYHPTLQRVPVPPSAVAQSKGVKAYNNDVSSSSTKPCASILCMRYVTPQGCPLEDQCHNFHVRSDYVEASRSMSESICCGLHNCYYTREMIRGRCAPHMSDSKFTLVLEDRSEVDILPAQLAFTVGLDHLSIRGQSRVINAKKQICRLHMEGRCKWTKDCGHVHLCRELLRCLQGFHFPSLVFLLSTETDAAKLRFKLAEVREFVASRSCLSLTSHLIQAGRATAVSCLAEFGALFTPQMAQAASSELQFDPPANQVLEESDFATEALRRPVASASTAAAGAGAPPPQASPPSVSVASADGNTGLLSLPRPSVLEPPHSAAGGAESLTTLAQRLEAASFSSTPPGE